MSNTSAFGGLQILHLSTLAFQALPCSCLRRLVNSPVGKQNIEICAKWLFLHQPAVARVLSHWFSPLKLFSPKHDAAKINYLEDKFLETTY